MENVNDVARKFIDLALENNISLSYNQLTRLCYNAQGISLAIVGQKIFREKITALTDGPFISELKSPQRITAEHQGITPNNIAAEKVIEFTWNIYKKALNVLTAPENIKDQTPWALTYTPGQVLEINEGIMTRYFTNFINNFEMELNEKKKRTIASA